MKSHKLWLLLLVATILVQLIIAGSMIFQFEDILKSGHEYKFRTAPIDPNDPFRGKYVSLSYKDNIVKVSLPNFNELYGKQVNAIIAKDKEGFAFIKSISQDSKSIKGDYFRSEITGVDSHQIVLNFPFDKYYMEEKPKRLKRKLYITKLQ